MTPWRGRARVTESPAGQRLRAVLDTNVVLSALLFDSGRLSPLRHHWQSGRIVLLVRDSPDDQLPNLDAQNSDDRKYGASLHRCI